jgi:hypothetical protein
VQQMSPIFVSDVCRFRSDPSFGELLVDGASCTTIAKGNPEVYGRFMGGSVQNTDNPGRFEQFGHCMHVAQSLINTGYFASC